MIIAVYAPLRIWQTGCFSLNRHDFPEYKNFIAKICNFLLTDAKKRGILLER